MEERVIKGEIHSEHPQDHWRFLPIDGETILDLGCGINSEHTPTPVWWVQNKAKMVYGIDPSQQSYEWFKTNFVVKNFINIMDYVDRTEKFDLYIAATKPTVMKIDVEGAEIFMNAINPSNLNDIRHIGIEYHNLSCLLSCEAVLKSQGYSIDYYKFAHLDIDYQGVLHAYKKIISTNKIPQTPDELHSKQMNEWKGGYK